MLLHRERRILHCLVQVLHFSDKQSSRKYDLPEMLSSYYWELFKSVGLTEVIEEITDSFSAWQKQQL